VVIKDQKSPTDSLPQAINAPAVLTNPGQQQQRAAMASAPFIYPVPARNAIYIQGLNPLDDNYLLSVTNLRGEQMIITGATKNNARVRIPTRNLPGGIYTITLKTAEKTVKMKAQVAR
jgi:hypothetical protein